MRNIRSSSAGQAALALLLVGSTVLLGACGGTSRSVPIAPAPSGSSSLPSAAASGSPAPDGSPAPATSVAPAAGAAGEGGLPVTVTADDDFSCSPATGTRHYTAAALARPEPTGGGHAAIVLTYCGTGSQRLERNPPLTVLDARGRALPVVVRYEPPVADRMTTFTRSQPMCLVLQWSGPPRASATGTTSASVRIGPASGRSAFAVELTASFGPSPALTASQWVTSSGGPGSCLGT